jgi:hypothetical protein
VYRGWRHRLAQLDVPCRDHAGIGCIDDGVVQLLAGAHQLRGGRVTGGDGGIVRGAHAVEVVARDQLAAGQFAGALEAVRGVGQLCFRGAQLRGAAVDGRALFRIGQAQQHLAALHAPVDVGAEPCDAPGCLGGEHGLFHGLHDAIPRQGAFTARGGHRQRFERRRGGRDGTGGLTSAGSQHRRRRHGSRQ